MNKVFSSAYIGTGCAGQPDFLLYEYYPSGDFEEWDDVVLTAMSENLALSKSAIKYKMDHSNAKPPTSHHKRTEPMHLKLMFPVSGYLPARIRKKRKSR